MFSISIIGLVGTFGVAHTTVGTILGPFELLDQVFAGPYNDFSSTNTVFDNHRLQTFTPTQTDLAAIDIPIILGPDSASNPRLVGVTITLYKIDPDNFNPFIYGTTTAKLPVESGSHTVHLDFAPPVQLNPGELYGFSISSAAAPRNVSWEQNDGSAGDLYADGSAFQIKKGGSSNPDRLISIPGDFGFATYYTDPAKGPNSPPEISNLNLDPRDFTRLLCNADVVDPDGDDVLPFTYDWIVNGVFLDYHGRSISKGIGVNTIQTGDEVSCILYATDGEDSNHLQSETITVQNTPPRPGAIDTRLNIFDGVPIAFCVNSPFNDSDIGDTIELVETVWFVNGIPISEPLPMPYPPYHTLEQPHFTGNDEISCQMTITDGTDSATQSSGNSVIVPPEYDIVPPVITLLGNDPEVVEIDAVYTDAGATALDDVDGDVTANIVIGNLPIDTSAVGTYTVTYDVIDVAGNAATQITRTVNVVEPEGNFVEPEFQEHLTDKMVSKFEKRINNLENRISNIQNQIDKLDERIQKAEGNGDTDKVEKLTPKLNNHVERIIILYEAVDIFQMSIGSTPADPIQIDLKENLLPKTVEKIEDRINHLASKVMKLNEKANSLDEKALSLVDKSAEKRSQGKDKQADNLEQRADNLTAKADALRDKAQVFEDLNEVLKYSIGFEGEPVIDESVDPDEEPVPIFS